jgi:hydrogenase/urease accessory protein HupE
MMPQVPRAWNDFHGRTLPLPAMKGLALTLAALLLASEAHLSAHPAPFSYLDVALGSHAVDVAVVAHVFDVAHDLGIDRSELLLDQAFARGRAGDIASLLQRRFHLDADGSAVACSAQNAIEILEPRQSLKLHYSCSLSRAAGALTVRALMFPYDPNHQTFINVYENGSLTAQAILDGGHDTLEYFAGTRQGVFAVVRKFVPSGIHHILIGPDHLLFLVGLLLLGGSIRQLLLVVTAFTVAHSVTLSLAALNLVSPPARLIEPAIALSIIYVGADNLLVRGGRDVRAWIALAFGFIHGFGFANVLREMGLPARALGWSLFSFNVGVEIGQLLVVVAVASALAALRARNEAAGRRLAFAGSLVVIVAGAFWFIQRVFFPGGMS